jgi:hypothetical protein
VSARPRIKSTRMIYWRSQIPGHHIGWPLREVFQLVGAGFPARPIVPHNQGRHEGRLLLKMGNQPQILSQDQNQPVGAGFRVRPVVPHNQGRHEGRPLLKMGNQPQR